jgi:hypothetical protein
MKGSIMSRDTENEALDRIQEIADVLSTLNGVPVDVQEGLRIIEAIARHRDISNLNPNDNEWLARIKRSNQ